MAKSIVAWDTETHLIKRGMGAPRLVCVSVADRQGPMLFDRERGLDTVEQILRDLRSVGHNMVYDLGVVVAEDPARFKRLVFEAIRDERVECTLVRQKMIDNAMGQLKYVWDDVLGQYKKQFYSLQRLIFKHGHGKKRSKGDDTWRLRYNELDGIPIEQWPDDARSYAMEDAVDTLTIRNSQQRMVMPEGIPRENSQVRAHWALHLQSLWGVRTDPESVSKLRAQLQADFDQHADTCKQYGFMRPNGKRNLKKIREAVEKWYRDANKSMKLTATGKISTDREQLTGTTHPGLLAVADAVGTQKLLTTYVPALERGTEVPINPSYNPILETYRTSCSGGMKIDGVPVGINIQNPPRGGGVRQCFKARDGYVFVFCDYDTLEMRTLAQVCLDLFGHSEIAEAAKAGHDFHLAMAAELMEMPYSQAERLYKNGDPKVSDMRQLCKPANYGFAGGMGWRTFIEYAKGYGYDGKEKPLLKPAIVKKLHKGFRRKWNEMVEYFNHCSFLCEGGKAEKIEFVRSGLMRGNVTYTATCNGFFQHLAAMGAKEALWNVAWECYIDSGSPLYGCRPWLFAHDEIGMEVPIAAIGPKGAHRAARRLQQVMIDSMKIWVPDVPIGASPAMARRWYKGAKDLYVNGIMVPSKPVKKGGKKVWVPDA